MIEAQLANDLAKVESQRKVVEAQKQTDLIAANANLAIETVNARAAEMRAAAKTANERIIANMYTDNPEYATLVRTQARADALKRTDKIYYFIDPALNPFLMMGTEGVTPIVNTGGK